MQKPVVNLAGPLQDREKVNIRVCEQRQGAVQQRAINMAGALQDKRTLNFVDELPSKTRVQQTGDTFRASARRKRVSVPARQETLTPVAARDASV